MTDKKMFDPDMVDKTESVSRILGQLDSILEECSIPAEYGAKVEDADFSDVSSEVYRKNPPEPDELQLLAEVEFEKGDVEQSLSLLFTYPDKERFIDISVMLSMMPSPKGFLKLLEDTLNKDQAEEVKDVLTP